MAPGINIWINALIMLSLMLEGLLKFIMFGIQRQENDIILN